MFRPTILLTLLLVGCSDSAQQSSNSTERVPPDPPAHTGNRWSDELAARSWGERDALLAKIIESSGVDCDLVKYHEYKGHQGKLAFWAAQCAGVGDYLVGIAADSTTKVVDCADIKRVNDDCWSVWDAKPKRRLKARAL